nr:ester cyclase [Burkholderia multivorans]
MRRICSGSGAAFAPPSPQRGDIAVTRTDLAARYHAYIDCLNRRDWAALDRHVAADVIHNDRALGLAGYRAMLEQDVRDIPDLRFEIEWLVCEPPRVACRLRFDCTPRATFLGLAVDGRRIAFSEHVFYEFVDGKIRQVWSVIDKAAIERQL